MKRNAKSRSGIAIIVALIFMMAFLTISTTIAQTATNMAKSTGGSYKSNQAFYNAETAMSRALYNYQHPGEGVLSGAPDEDEEGAGNMQWKVLGVGADEGLMNEITDNENEVWSSYPFPGSGTAGKDCDAYNAPTDMKKFTASLMRYISTTEGTAIAADIEKTISSGGMGKPQDHPCNWNKLKDNDSAIEIPLYGVDSAGQRTQITFTDFQVRVRTACDAKAIKSPSGDQGNGPTTAELIYEGAGMCEAGKRYVMYAPEQTNTIVNWGLYTEEDGDYMIPLKNFTKGKEFNGSNITSLKINIGEDQADFIVLDQSNTEHLGNLKIGNSKTTTKISSALKLPPSGIENPYLRLTLEFPFAGKHYFVGSDGDTSIPNLEYQILYKTNGGSPAAGTSQISGIPVIIGEGYSGGFRHMIRANIYETPTGFDYIYQKP
ncbi:MAG: hypothetical protein UT33_C0009G0042 [Candidatus Peregrinibacteria bacterium GW2011_GWC2_39_14]|nr:MAG: hypothetical protein US92_C0005G0042 [Candidatus Peregrinibacteria bacterium GW2011_GWA2_38_36]KKR06591.1 MAG: hypothetical protein UT33_C0009G0042 [Candidatus Peregrinibacteria bacterium GW2011_GWC2_39_14]